MNPPRGSRDSTDSFKRLGTNGMEDWVYIERGRLGREVGYDW